jgi:hypothetical protein
MITISKKENIIFTQIKSLSLEYEDGIPESILKMELDLYNQDLNNILEALTKKNIIIHENNKIKISNELNKEISIEDETDKINNEIPMDNEVDKRTINDLSVDVEIDEVTNEIPKDNKINNEISKITNEVSIDGEIDEVSDEVFVEEEINIDYENELNLNENERKSLNIIKNIVKDDKTISKYLLEGNLLYGELKLSNFSMYHILLSLKNNNLIKIIKKNNGYYYQLLI